MVVLGFLPSTVAPENLWLEYFLRLPFGVRCIFRGKVLLVSGSVYLVVQLVVDKLWDSMYM